MIPDKYQDDFYAEKRSEKIKFCINDGVEITSGEFKGILCAVISIQQIEPEVTFLVERGDTGESLIIKQSELRLLDS